MKRRHVDFRVGDRVVLDPMKVDQLELGRHGSKGKFGTVYTIAHIDRHDTLGVLLYESNWHNLSWLSLAKREKNIIGGKIL